MACPDDASLAALSEGRAPHAERAALLEHFDGCAQCHALVGVMLRSTTASLSQTLPSLPEAAELEPGLRLGHYLVLRRLGSGSLGSVFAAWDGVLEREVAIKVLHRRADDAADARLLVEARALARLQHPNVVAVHEVTTWRDRSVLVMELVRGTSLRQWAATRPPQKVVLAAFVECGRGLAAAHDAGVVHRDVKPDNVVIDANGRPRLIDFGLAATATVPGEVAGTPAYMALSQLEGAPADASADQFAWWLSLHEALTGARAFSGATIDALKQAHRSVTPATAGVPPWLRRHVLRGLSATPGRRFASMQEAVAIVARGPLWPRFAAGGAALALGLAVALAAWPANPCGEVRALMAPTAAATPPALREAAAEVSRAVDRCEQLERADRPVRAACLHVSVAELSIALEASARASAVELPLHPRLLRRVQPPARCERLPAPSVKAPASSEREALIQSQVLHLEADAQRNSGTVGAQLAAALAMRAHAEGTPVAAVKAWARLVEAQARARATEVDAAGKLVGEISTLAGLGLREETWAVINETTFACQRADCRQLRDRAARLVASLDEPWASAFWTEVNADEPAQAAAEWGAIPGAGFEAQRALLSQLEALRATDDVPALESALARARGIGGSHSKAWLLADAELNLACLQLDRAAIDALVERLERLEAPTADLATVLLHARVKQAVARGELSAALVRVESALKTSTDLRVRDWLALQRAELKFLSGEETALDEQEATLALLEPHLSEAHRGMLASLRAIAALRRGDATSFRDEPPAGWLEDPLIQWRLAVLEGRTAEIERLFSTATAAGNDARAVLVVEALLARGRWAEAREEARRLRGATHSGETLGEATHRFRYAAWKSGRLEDACSTPFWPEMLALSPVELQRIRDVEAACVKAVK